MSGSHTNQFMQQPEKLLSDLDFKQLFLKLFEYKWLILSFTLLGLMIGIFLYFYHFI